MLKLVTGLPGDGKTSNELWDFLHADQYKGRPKYCTPVNGFKAAEHGVTEIEHIKDWRDLPEGAVVFCDEVQRYCGTDLGRDVPAWVEDFAIHRHSGKDFIFTTQSPMFLHPFARKLAKPHVHYIRPWNMKGARYIWDNVQNDPNTKTAKALGQRQLVKPNPKVFTLYTSTVLDTHKARPPYKIFAVLGMALVVVVACSFYTYRSVRHFTEEPIATVDAQHKAVTTAAQENAFDFAPSIKDKAVWTEQNLKPRIPGSLHTAPVYDALTAPTDFPRVAACMSAESRGSCSCYTQQGTPIDVPASACYVFVSYGSFDPWLTGRKQQVEPASRREPVVQREPGKGAAFTVVADSGSTAKRPAQSLN